MERLFVQNAIDLLAPRCLCHLKNTAGLPCTHIHILLSSIHLKRNVSMSGRSPSHLARSGLSGLPAGRIDFWDEKVLLQQHARSISFPGPVQIWTKKRLENVAGRANDASVLNNTHRPH
jgi:hypothetical protein